jgi:phosphatidylglycerophosphatase A
MVSTMESVQRNPTVFGLAAGIITYLVVDYIKPWPIYKDKVALENEMISPMTLGAAAAVAVGLLLNARNNASANMMP